MMRFQRLNPDLYDEMKGKLLKLDRHSLMSTKTDIHSTKNMYEKGIQAPFESAELHNTVIYPSDLCPILALKLKSATDSDNEIVHQDKANASECYTYETRVNLDDCSKVELGSGHFRSLYNEEENIQHTIVKKFRSHENILETKDSFCVNINVPWKNIESKYPEMQVTFKNDNNNTLKANTKHYDVNENSRLDGRLFKDDNCADSGRNHISPSAWNMSDDEESVYESQVLKIDKKTLSDIVSEVRESIRLSNDDHSILKLMHNEQTDFDKHFCESPFFPKRPNINAYVEAKDINLASEDHDERCHDINYFNRTSPNNNCMYVVRNGSYSYYSQDNYNQTLYNSSAVPDQQIAKSHALFLTRPPQAKERKRNIDTTSLDDTFQEAYLPIPPPQREVSNSANAMNHRRYPTASRPHANPHVSHTRYKKLPDIRAPQYNLKQNRERRGYNIQRGNRNGSLIRDTGINFAVRQAISNYFDRGNRSKKVNGNAFVITNGDLDQTTFATDEEYDTDDDQEEHAHLYKVREREYRKFCKSNIETNKQIYHDNAILQKLKANAHTKINTWNTPYLHKDFNCETEPVNNVTFVRKVTDPRKFGSLAHMKQIKQENSQCRRRLQEAKSRVKTWQSPSKINCIKTINTHKDNLIEPYEIVPQRLNETTVKFPAWKKIVDNKGKKIHKRPMVN